MRVMVPTLIPSSSTRLIERLPSWLREPLAEYQHRLALVLALACVSNLVMLVGPVLAGSLSDTLLASGMRGNSPWLLAGLALLIVLRAAGNYYSRVTLGYVNEALTVAVRLRCFAHMQALSFPFHRANKSGELVAAATEDVDVITGFVTGTAINLVPTLLLLGGSLVAVILMQPIALVLAALLAPAYYLLVRLLTRRLPEVSAELRERSAGNLHQLIAFLQSNSLIKATGSEAWAMARLRDGYAAEVMMFDRANRLHSLVGPLSQAAAAIAVVLLVWLSAPLLADGSPGKFVALVLYILLMLRPLTMLTEALADSLAVLGSAKRLDSVMREGTEVLCAPEISQAAVPAQLELDGVGFAYPGQGLLFNNLSLALAQGEVIAITGPNGVGKTTLLNLLVRFEQPRNGRMVLGETAIGDWPVGQLRDRIGYVQQDAALLDESIRTNLTLGRDTTDDAALYAALSLAGADFVSTLPDGLDTVLGESGETLSGGERQRLSLARLIVAEPALVLLDEPTAMFDLVAEEALVARLRPWLSNRMTIIVTHRPLMLELADRIYQMSETGLEPRAGS